MGTPREPKAAKYFVALLSSSHEHLVQVESDLVGILGEVDGKSEALSWAASKYYEKEMGPGLLRCFFSFSTLASPENLAAVKLQTQAIEERYRAPVAGRAADRSRSGIPSTPSKLFWPRLRTPANGFIYAPVSMPRRRYFITTAAFMACSTLIRIICRLRR